MTRPHGTLSPVPPAEGLAQVGQNVLGLLADAMRGGLVGDAHRERDLGMGERPDPDVVDVVAEAGRARWPRLPPYPERFRPAPFGRAPLFHDSGQGLLQEWDPRRLEDAAGGGMREWTRGE